MKVLNIIAILLISGISGFLSMAFYLGSIENKEELVRQLPISYCYRFGAFSLLGIIGISLLVLINFLINKIIKNENKKTNLKELTKIGLLTTVIFCLIATYVFYRI
ncbi:hypothetical protein L1S34_03845 [Flavobacterium sp. K77]|uniref:hypothetical protein n=1 Tax=Flavobacterium sp. K77 TaxID=2910676 RepID=UPI001F41B085|nr:hypothetical protein [Flavobacterium sp. K77]MCF6140408.1 hypothetical protein [Flavobacterium sp. K77]